jgi:monosaccharide-transporting ATPase
MTTPLAAAPARSAMVAGPRIAMRGIVKRFDGVLALDCVDLEVQAGEVRAIVGENGAGKSTLIKILTGVYAPDAGSIAFEGRHVVFRAPHEAQKAGIATIYQEVNLVPTLSAAENIFLGCEPRRHFGPIDWRRMRSGARAILERYGMSLDVNRPVAEFGLATQQMIAIVRALSLGGRAIVMDEPTSALTHREVDQLMAMIGQIRSEVVSVLYISHRLDELFRIADSVTVLRDGKHVMTAEIGGLTPVHIVNAMLGRAVAHAENSGRRIPAASARRPSLRAESVSRVPRVNQASVAVGAGEIVGLAGLQGSGRTELMRLIFGADERDSGRVAVGEEDVPLGPGKALAQGIAYLPEDRKADGIIPGLSLRENMTLIVLPALTRLGIVRRGREREIVEDFIERLGIRAASPDIRVRDLSGGNQQKVLIARLLCADPRFLLLDDPMRGIDVGAKAEIERLIVTLADSGLGVLVTSSELEEVLSLGDRIVVVRDGRTVGELKRGEGTFETVAEAIAEDALAAREP